MREDPAIRDAFDLERSRNSPPGLGHAACLSECSTVTPRQAAQGRIVAPCGTIALLLHDTGLRSPFNAQLTATTRLSAPSSNRRSPVAFSL